MLGVRFNGERSRPIYRFSVLENMRMEVNRARAEDEAYASMLYVAYGDVRTTSIGLLSLGYSESEQVDTSLIDEARRTVLDLRRAGNELTTDAPKTARVVAVALVTGASTMKTQIIGMESAETLSEGALVNIVFADLNTSFFIVEESGEVTMAGSSVPIGIDCLQAHSIDPTVVGLPETPSIDTQLALLLAALTAMPGELEMLA